MSLRRLLYTESQYGFNYRLNVSKAFLTDSVPVMNIQKNFGSRIRLLSGDCKMYKEITYKNDCTVQCDCSTDSSKVQLAAAAM